MLEAHEYKRFPILGPRVIPHERTAKEWGRFSFYPLHVDTDPDNEMQAKGDGGKVLILLGADSDKGIIGHPLCP